MEYPLDHRVIAAERLEEGVVITFEDGRCAIYSASLLYETLPQAQAVEPEVDD
jgi:hypothetical protein